MFSRKNLLFSALIILINLIVCLVAVVGISYLVTSNYILEGDGNIITVDRAIKDFKNIEINGAFNVELVASTEPFVTIAADENLLEKIAVSNIGETVIVEKERIFPYLARINIKPSIPITIKVGYANLESLKIIGESNVSLSDSSKIRSDKLNLDIVGNAGVNLDLFVKELNLNSTGNALVNLVGSADKQKIIIDGEGAYNLVDLESREVEANLTGSGRLIIRAQDKLNAQLTGSGVIEYNGDPKDLVRNINGTGDIKKAD